jgi:5-methylcytosine-specific restriction endonuclease McrA
MTKKTPTWYRKKMVARAKLLAKERDNFICQHCRKDGKIYQMHGSHVFSEGRYHGMSDMLENIKTLCAQCHIDWHENPLGQDWFRKKFPERYEFLLKQSRKTIKRNWKQEYENSTWNLLSLPLMKNPPPHDGKNN